MVLSPFLFTLYTDFQHRSDLCHLQKVSDDSVVVGCIRDGQDGEYRDLVNSFVDWTARNHLLLNVTKTKEMVMDFRRRRSTISPITIMGQNVELVDTYKHLGVQLNNKPDWKANTESVYKKGMSRLYFLRRLRSLNVCCMMMEIFYQSVVTGAVFFAAVCWEGSIKGPNAKKLNKLTRKAGSVLGCPLDGFEQMVKRRSLNKLTPILHNTSHPLHDLLVRQRSTFSNRLVQLRCSKGSTKHMTYWQV
ncbi:hypothetical protein NFI96_009778 [Prochilodus magdalenae]|nr:hypothetical protein NFI96_009778 [Prochilodus magdalenae]